MTWQYVTILILAIYGARQKKRAERYKASNDYYMKEKDTLYDCVKRYAVTVEECEKYLKMIGIARTYGFSEKRVEEVLLYHFEDALTKDSK